MEINIENIIEQILNCIVHDFKYSDILKIEQNKIILNNIKINRRVTVDIQKFSKTGLHIYELKDIEDKNQFLENILEIIGDNNKEILKKLNKTMEQVSLSKEIKKEYLKTSDKRSKYIKSEQSLKKGHPLHPFSKFKSIKNGEDLVYTPEMGLPITLSYYLIDKNLISTYCHKSFNQNKFENQLLKETYIDDEIPNSIKNGSKEIFPMHPYQEEIIKIDPLFKKLMKEGQITKIENNRNRSSNWYSTSSMRSLTKEHLDYSLKFSLDIKITNSNRKLSKKDCDRGLDLSLLLSKIEDLKFLNNSFIIQEEPMYKELNLSKEIAEQTRYIVRDNKELNHEKSYLLASLYEDKGLTNLLGNNINLLKAKTFFKDYLNQILSPIFTLAFTEGILLGAHAQNIIFEYENSIQKTYFKDCQGSGFYDKFLTKITKSHGAKVTDNGNILNFDQLTKIFFYYTIKNSTFFLINALAKKVNDIDFNYAETLLLNDLRNYCFESPYEEVKFLIESEYLYYKSNLLCSLENRDENTDKNPLDLYKKEINPLKYSVRDLAVERKIEGFKKLTPKNKVITVRDFNLEKDIETFHFWHHQDYISHFWEMPYSLEEHKKYISNLKNSCHTNPIVVEIDGELAGYFEVYWAFDDRIAPYAYPDMYDKGIHFLFGNKKFLKTINIEYAINHVCDYIFKTSPLTKKIWGEPRVDNSNVKKLISYLPGWQYLHDFDFPHKRAMLIKCEREIFYKAYEDKKDQEMK